ncbi:6858_t:CDS:2 [Ambispora leptoticha]|uniref:Transcription initiation factor TFIID subunit 13 n=1 Tax=Ambispora leptoticha TaxID=144679 RepID=A0A9N8YWG1_9GLOM|nr:6858_t:CDS:2 [Ambispora leptoticha]
MESRRGRPPKEKKGLFAKDLSQLMYGFGDVPNPAPDTVNVLEEMVIDYITDMCIKASQVAGSRNKVRVEDFKFILRNDPKKLARVEELLYMSEDIKKARQSFDPREMEVAKGAGGVGESSKFEF